MSSNDGFHYRLALSDIDLSLLPPSARTPGTDAFRAAVTKLIERDFSGFGGRVKIAVTDEIVDVEYSRSPTDPHPLDVAVAKLQRGEYEQAVTLLEILNHAQPDDSDVLYNLGMADSDMGRLDQAVAHLTRLTVLQPKHINGLVALGVAYSRQQNWAAASEALGRAVILDPSNPWAHRNLGACLIQDGKLADAELHLRKAVELSPNDQQAVYGLAQALHQLDQKKEADDLYIRTIKLNGDSPVAEQARLRRSELAQESFRAPTGVRMDAVMYLLGAMQKFAAMSRDEMQKIVFEIAILGQRGLDTNDSAQKYTLRSLPGKFSGLHLLCYMFIGFRKIAPEHSIGFDLSKEFEVAQTMFTAGEGESK